nr:transposon TX1 [Tanacetum cinerariifolium]
MDETINKHNTDIQTFELEEITTRKAKRETSPTSSMEINKNKLKKAMHVNERVEDTLEKTFNQCKAPEEHQNNNAKVGRRSVRKAKALARKTKVEGLGEATKGMSDVYKEFHEVDRDNDKVFKFKDNHVGNEENEKWEISIEQVKEVGDMIRAWCIFGDLNMVRCGDDRLNSQVNLKEASKFSDFINNTKLIQIPMGGRKFTRISDDGLKFSKLDRILSKDKFWGHIEKIDELKNEAMKWELEAFRRPLSDSERCAWLDTRKEWEGKEKETQVCSDKKLESNGT